MLARNNIKSMSLPHMKLSGLLCPVKDNLGLRTRGDYRILYECSRVYTGQTGHSVDIRLKEHQWHIHLEHLDKLDMAEHSIDQGHRIQFHISSIFIMKTRCMVCTVREAMRLNSTLTISTERVKFVSVNHGNLLSAP
jgi:hypothetical protein